MGDYATLNLRLKNNQFNKGIDQSAKKTSQLSGAVRGIGTALGGALAVGKLLSFAKSAVNAYAVQEMAIKKLDAALDVNGQNLSRLTPMYQTFAAAMQRQTIYGDEAILSQMAYAKNLGVTADKLEDATTAAIGLAAKFNLDLKTSMMLVGRASQGQTQMLTRYGITLDETLTPQEKFNELLKIGAENFSLAQKETETTEGKLKQLSNTWGDFKETLGEGMMKTYHINDALSWTKNLLTGSEDVQKESEYLDNKIRLAHQFDKRKKEVTKPIPKTISKEQQKILDDQKNAEKIYSQMAKAGWERELKKLSVKEQIVKLQKKEHDLMLKGLNIGGSKGAQLLQESKSMQYRWEDLQKEQENKPKPDWMKDTGGKLESTLTDAVEKGSMDALKLSSTQLTKDDKLLAKNTETANNTKESTKELKKLNKRLIVTNTQTVNVF